MTVAEMFEQYAIDVTVANAMKVELELLDVNTIEQLQLPAYALSDIPRSITNKITSTVESTSERMDYINKEAVKAYKEISARIESVKEIVKGLINDKQKFVITEKYINGRSWTEIQDLALNQEMPTSKTMLKIHKKNGERFLQRVIDQKIKIGQFIVKEEVE